MVAESGTKTLKVSVIIPCFRQARYLRTCIAALQAQTHEDWEAIIVNDGSPDDTTLVAEQLCSEDRRVRLVTQQNSGLSAARNAGVRIAQGDLVQLLDADDMLQPEKLSLQVAHFLKSPETDVVIGNARYFNDEEPAVLTSGMYASFPGHDWITDCWQASVHDRPRFVRRNLFPVCSPLVKRDVFERVGLFDTELKALEDWDFWWRCDAAGVCFELQSAEGAHALVRMHGSSMTNDSPRMLEAAFRFRLKHLSSVPAGTGRSLHLQALLYSATQGSIESRSRNLAAVSEKLPLGLEWVNVMLTRGLCTGWRGEMRLRAALRLLPYRLRHWLSQQHGLNLLLDL